MKRESIYQAILNAVDETDDGLLRYPIQTMRWAKYIEKSIGSKNGYKVKAKAVTVQGCIIDFPDDCYAVEGILIGDHESECNLRYKDITKMNYRTDYRAGEDVYDRDLTLLWSPLETTWISSLMWEEVAGQISMVNTYDNQVVTILYSTIETDINGHWIVNESHTPAITAYIIYMYAKKHGWRLFKSEKMLRDGQRMTIRDLERAYNIEIRNARALDGQETEIERRIL